MVGMRGQLPVSAGVVAAAWQPGMHGDQHHNRNQLRQSIMGWCNQGLAFGFFYTEAVHKVMEKVGKVPGKVPGVTTVSEPAYIYCCMHYTAVAWLIDSLEHRVNTQLNQQPWPTRHSFGSCRHVQCHACIACVPEPQAHGHSKSKGSASCLLVKHTCYEAKLPATPF